LIPDENLCQGYNNIYNGYNDTYQREALEEYDNTKEYYDSLSIYEGDL